MTGKKARSWSDVKAVLQSRSPGELVTLVRDLYRLSADNRRYLHTRVLDVSAESEWYKRRVADSIAPDITAHGQCKVRISDAKNAIRDYRLASGDVAGTLDLMFTFVERGVDHYLDFGYDDEAFLQALVGMLDATMRMLAQAGEDVQALGLPRMKGIGERAAEVGGSWEGIVADMISRDFPDLCAR